MLRVFLGAAYYTGESLLPPMHGFPGRLPDAARDGGSQRRRTGVSVIWRREMSVKERNRVIEGLVAEYGDALTRYFMRRSFDLPEAEEMTNELFFRLVRRVTTEPHQNLGALLFHSAANLVKDRFRRASARRAFLAANADLDANNTEVISPERVLQGKQSLQSILALLDTLDKRSKDMFLLHRVEGLKYAEIAAIYGISVSAVEKHIMKCLALVATRSQDEA